MTESTYGTPLYPPPRPRRPLARRLLPLVAAAVAGAAVAVAVILSIGGRHGTAEPKPVTPATTPAAPATVTMSGHIALRRYDKDMDPSFRVPNWSVTSSGGCEGRHGFDDMTEGTDVTVYDAAGKVIGSSSLEAGLRSGSSCRWAFSVSDLPPNPFYQVEVSHRGKVTIQRSDVGEADLTLG